ncbi:MAG: SAM-dependent methyltransferase [Pirellulaceae bacterium]
MPLSIAKPAAPSFAKRAFFVMRAWWKQPEDVATICPSSPYLTEHIADRVCVREASSLLELGPGAGGTTAALLTKMRPDSRLLAIDKMPAFGEALKEIVDPRLSIEIGDAVDLIGSLERHGFGQPDVIVSGIPFSALPNSVAKAIAQSVYAALAPGGTFIAYQVRSDIEQYALPLFGPSKCEVITLNLPPLKVFEWKKVTT